MLLPILSFLLLLNSLIFLSFFGFLRNAGTWIVTCVYFFREYHDFLICFHACQCRRDCRICGSTSTAIGRRWKTVGNLQTHILALNEFSQRIFFFQGESFQVWTALSLFTVNAPWLCQLPSVDMSLPNRHAHVRFGPIVRRVKNP